MTMPEVCIRAPGASTHFADTCSDSHIKHSAKEGPFPNSFRDHYFFSRCTSWRHVSKFQRRHPFLATSSTLSHGSSCLDFSYGNDQRCNRVREHHNSKAAFSRLLPAGKVGTRSMLCRLFLATSLELGLLEVIKIYNANDMFSGGIEMPFLKFLSILVDVRICFLTPLNV